MIWQEELLRKQRQRTAWAFYGGCLYATVAILLVLFAVVQATGGIGGGCP